MIHILLKPGLENFEHYFASVWDECNCVIIWTFFGIAFLWAINLPNLTFKNVTFISNLSNTFSDIILEACIFTLSHCCPLGLSWVREGEKKAS